MFAVAYSFLAEGTTNATWGGSTHGTLDDLAEQDNDIQEQSAGYSRLVNILKLCQFEIVYLLKVIVFVYGGYSLLSNKWVYVTVIFKINLTLLLGTLKFVIVFLSFFRQNAY
jgi:hypothetical protein